MTSVEQLILPDFHGLPGQKFHLLWVYYDSLVSDGCGDSRRHTEGRGDSQLHGDGFSDSQSHGDGRVILNAAVIAVVIPTSS